MTEQIDIRVRLRGGKVAAAEAHAVAEGVEHIGNSARRSTTGLSQMRNSMRGFGGMSSIVAAGMQRVANAARVMTFAAGAAAAAAATLGVKYNNTLDQQEVAFTTFFKSGKKARALIQELQQLATDSPVLDLETTGRGARLLLNYGLAAKQVVPFVKALGDSSAASGKSIQEVLPMAALAIGQIVSKGKLQAEEMNQLMESVGLNRALLAKNLGMTKEQFSATFAKGSNLTDDKAIPAILKTLQQNTGGAADAIAKTPLGRFKQAQERLAKRMSEVTRPAYLKAGEGFEAAAEWLKKPQVAAGFEQAGVKVGEFIDGFIRRLPAIIATTREVATGIIDFAKTVITAIKPAVPFFTNVLFPLFKGFAEGVLSSIVAVLAVVAPVLGAVGKAAKPLRGIIEGIGNVLGVVFSPAVIMSVAGKLAPAFKLLAGPIKVVGKALGGAGRAVGQFVSIFLQRLPIIGTIARAVFGAVRTKIGGIVGFLKNLGGKVAGPAKAVGRAIYGGISAAAGALAGFMDGLLNTIIDGLNTVIDGMNKINPLGDIGHIANVGSRATTGVDLGGGALDFVRPAVTKLQQKANTRRSTPIAPGGFRRDGSSMVPRVGGGPALAGAGFNVNTTVVLDGKAIAKATGRAALDSASRR